MSKPGVYSVALNLSEKDLKLISSPGKIKRQYVLRSLDHPHNCYIPYNKLNALKVGGLSARERDFLDIISGIYMADLCCQRGGDLLSWQRSIRLHLALREPGYWDACKADFEKLLSFLCGDIVELNFYTLARDDTPILKKRGEINNRIQGCDCVALLSGGLDSAAGAVKLLKDGRKPLFLRHYTNEKASSERVINGISRLFERDTILPIIFLRCNLKGVTRKAEPSQRSRSLLFLGFAAIASAALGCLEIYINENGIIAYNLPLTSGRIGSYSTKTAHPYFLSMLERLISSVFNKPLRIANLFADQTKQDVVKVLFANRAEDVISVTHSCMTSRKIVSEHCGSCIPCLYRMVSVGGITQREPNDVYYMRNPFADFFYLKPMDRINLVDMLQLVYAFLYYEDSRLLEIYPELIHLSYSSNDLAGIIKLHRRWAQQVHYFIQRVYPEMYFLIDKVTQSAMNALREHLIYDKPLRATILRQYLDLEGREPIKQRILRDPLTLSRDVYLYLKRTIL